MTGIDALQRMAESYGVQTWYQTDTGQRIEATPEELLAVLRVLGAPCDSVECADDALLSEREE